MLPEQIRADDFVEFVMTNERKLRQALTAAPYALGPWQLIGTSLSYAGGNVGVGTASPATLLHARGTAPVMILQDNGSAESQVGYVGFWNDTSTETGRMGFGNGGNPHLSIVNARTDGDVVVQTTAGDGLRVTSTGRVGIGAAAPSEKLEVRGTIRLGSGGQYFAPAGMENLRILRGKVSSTGSVLLGSGFTASRSSAGVYTVDFNPAYPLGEHPIVTASAESNGPAKFAMINSPTQSSVVVRIVNGSGTAVDGDFYFIAAGPR